MNPIPYDELTIGSRYESTSRTITETDLSMSCMLTGDWHPIHADEEFARTAGLGQRVLHGPFGILLAMGMAAHLPEFADPIIAATGIKEWRFLRPIFPGTTLYVRAEIIDKRVTSDGVRAIVERRLQLIDHEHQVIQEGTSGFLMRPQTREERL